MRYLINIPNLLKPIIEGVTETITIKSVTALTGSYELDVDCDSYITIGKTLIIEGSSYLVNSINPLVVIPIDGGIPIEGTFETYTPTFSHGTVRGVNEERVQIVDTREALPLVYLAETLRERYNGDETQSKYMTASLRMFVLDESSYEDYLIEDFYDKVITPMRNLAELVIEEIESAKEVNEVESFDIINHTKFANFIASKGYETNIFCETLTGVEIEMSVSFNRDFCKCK